jgi:hypothetical protein
MISQLAEKYSWRHSELSKEPAFPLVSLSHGFQLMEKIG